MIPAPEAVLRESFGRREFLRRGAGGILLTLGGALPGCRGAAREGGQTGFLSTTEMELLDAVCQRLLPGGDRAPSARELDVAGEIDRLLPQLDSTAASDFQRLLALFEWSPLVFEARPARFTSLPPKAQDRVLRGWAESRFGFRRTGFVAIKRLAMSVYYAKETSWPAIGFPGPWLES